VGVPLIVIVLLAQATFNPEGNPVAAPIPVAPDVVCVIAVRGVLIHKVGVEDAAPTVFNGFTVIVPVAFTLPHPPVSGME
jgi:hypothetical protein